MRFSGSHAFSTSVVLLLITTGCAANPYKTFFTNLAPPNAVANGMIAPLQGEPTISIGTDLERDRLGLMEQGYLPLGYSNFNGKLYDQGLAVEQGKAIRASLIVLYGKYTNTLSGTTPLVLPAPPIKSTTTTQGTIYGGGGTATYSGTSQTTTDGGYNTYHIPYRQDRYDQMAIYFAKNQQKVVFGTMVRDLTPEERQRLGRNRGVFIDVVVRGTPAFAADVFRGDVLIRIGGKNTDDMTSYMAVRESLAHTTGPVPVEILRDGHPVSLVFELRN